MANGIGRKGSNGLSKQEITVLQKEVPVVVCCCRSAQFDNMGWVTMELKHLLSTARR